jgi:hypothetical protein
MLKLTEWKTEQIELALARPPTRENEREGKFHAASGNTEENPFTETKSGPAAEGRKSASRKILRQKICAHRNRIWQARLTNEEKTDLREAWHRMIPPERKQRKTACRQHETKRRRRLDQIEQSFDWRRRENQDQAENELKSLKQKTSIHRKHEQHKWDIKIDFSIKNKK